MKKILLFLSLFILMQISYSNGVITYSKHYIPSHDGALVCLEEAGDPKGTPILFIHGFSQSKESWKTILKSPALQGFRLLALDLRGHGESDKSLSDYSSSNLWARDLNAVIEKLQLNEFVLVCWSYGGLVCLDYIRYFGTEKLKGINLISACTKYQIPMDVILNSQGESFMLKDLASDSFEEASHSMKLFNQLLTKDKMDDAIFYEFMGESIKTPNYVRFGMMDRNYSNNDLLPNITVPILASYGEKDGVVRYENEDLDLFPNLQLSLYADCGHCPFLEFPERFIKELVSFMNQD